MDLKRTINGIIIFMVCIMQVASQHLPSRQTFKQDLPYDDDYGNSNIESYFTPYQRIRQKQKFITATGNNEEKAPDEIAFDTYNMFGYPALLKRLRQENKYLPTKDQNQLQQLQQTVATNSKGKQYEKSLQEQQKQSQTPLSSGFKPIKDNGNKFDDVLYPFDEKAANDAATEDRNVNENLTPTSSSQLPLQELNENRQNDADDNTSENILNYFFMPPESRRTDVLLQKRPIRSNNPKHQLSNFEKMQRIPIWSTTDDDDYLFLKRSAFPAYKRQKAKPQQTPFLPSISAGAMTNLGHFFTDLTNNVQFMENRQLNADEKQLLEGEHPIAMLKEELMRTVDGKPDGRFLNTVRTYQPSQKIRSLVAMNPQGYHGSQFLDPNYYYIGLG